MGKIGKDFGEIDLTTSTFYVRQDKIIKTSFQLDKIHFFHGIGYLVY
jgi:hypothetical protein